MNKAEMRLITSRIKSKKAAFDAGSIGAVIDVLDICDRSKLPLPAWASEALKKDYHSGSNGGRSRRQYQSDMIDLERYEVYEDCVRNGITKTHAFEATSKILELSRLHGAEDSIRRSIKSVRKRTKDNPVVA